MPVPAVRLCVSLVIGLWIENEIVLVEEIMIGDALRSVVDQDPLLEIVEGRGARGEGLSFFLFFLFLLLFF